MLSNISLDTFYSLQPACCSDYSDPQSSAHCKNITSSEGEFHLRNIGLVMQKKTLCLIILSCKFSTVKHPQDVVK